jgi:hypothetical protein
MNSVPPEPLKTRVSVPFSPSTVVGGVARIPDERIVSLAEERSVSTAVRVGEVVASSAEEDLGTTATDEGVVAVPPKTVVRSVVVKAPFRSSILMVSSPLPAAMSMAANVLRSTEKSAEPSSRASTWSWFGSTALRRSVIRSACGVPEMWSVPSPTVALTAGTAAAAVAALASPNVESAIAPTMITVPRPMPMAASGCVDRFADI